MTPLVLEHHVPPSMEIKDAVTSRIATITEKIEKGQAEQKDLDELALFSPFTIEDVDQELLVLGALLAGVYLSKTERGTKLLNTIIKEYFGTISSIVSSVSRSGATHTISALTSQMLTVRMIRRLGLITNDEANSIHHELMWAINKVFIPDVISSISGLGTMVFGTALPALKG